MYMQGVVLFKKSANRFIWALCCCFFLYWSKCSFSVMEFKNSVHVGGFVDWIELLTELNLSSGQFSFEIIVKSCWMKCLRIWQLIFIIFIFSFDCFILPYVVCTSENKCCLTLKRKVFIFIFNTFISSVKANLELPLLHQLSIQLW